MFGYVRPQKAELLVREFEQYRGVYCALCRQLGKSYGALARMTLSYDCTFLAMLMMGLSSHPAEFEAGRCVVNPLKKCTYCTGERPELIYAAALSVAMTFRKLQDDLSDERLSGKIRACLLLPLTFRAHRHAARDFPEIERLAAALAEGQREAENSAESSIDACADPTAGMLAGVCREMAESEPQARVLEQFGYFLGRWIYLIDAADDLEKDLKEGAFNPLVHKFSLTANSNKEEIQAARNWCNEALNFSLARAIEAFQLLDFTQFDSILGNVVRQGMPEMQKLLLFHREQKDGKKKKFSSDREMGGPQRGERSMKERKK